MDSEGWRLLIAGPAKDMEFLDQPFLKSCTHIFIDFSWKKNNDWECAAERMRVFFRRMKKIAMLFSFAINMYFQNFHCLNFGVILTLMFWKIRFVGQPYFTFFTDVWVAVSIGIFLFLTCICAIAAKKQKATGRTVVRNQVAAVAPAIAISPGIQVRDNLRKYIFIAFIF